MMWWIWVVVVVALVAVILGAIAWLQARRRRSGVIVGADKPRRRRR